MLRSSRQVRVSLFFSISLLLVPHPVLSAHKLELESTAGRDLPKSSSLELDGPGDATVASHPQRLYKRSMRMRTRAQLWPRSFNLLLSSNTDPAAQQEPPPVPLATSDSSQHSSSSIIGSNTAAAHPASNTALLRQDASLRRALTDADVGISSFCIPGVLYNSSSSGQLLNPEGGAGLLHVWLRHFVDDDVGLVKVRGFYFFESINDPINKRVGYTDHHMRVPVYFYNNRPKLMLTPLTEHGAPAVAKPIELDRFWTLSHDRPWLLEGNFSVAAKQVQASVLGWDRTVTYKAMYGGLAPVMEPTYHVAIGAYPNLTTSAMVHLLSHHISYHQRLGFKSWLLHVLPRQEAALLAYPIVQDWLGYGALQMMLWENVLEYNLEYQHPAQGLYYNQALLAYYGTGVWLGIVDLDEYLAVPSPIEGGISALGARCWEGRAYACMKRYNIACPECMNGKVAETDLWSQPEAQTHPLSRYTLVLEDYPWQECKAIVNPDLVYGWFVHDGHVVGQSREVVPEALVSENATAPVAMVDYQDCAAWLHVRTMIKDRDICERHEKRGEDCPPPYTLTDWQWVFGGSNTQSTPQSNVQLVQQSSLHEGQHQSAPQPDLQSVPQAYTQSRPQPNPQANMQLTQQSAQQEAQQPIVVEEIQQQPVAQPTQLLAMADDSSVQSSEVVPDAMAAISVPVEGALEGAPLASRDTQGMDGSAQGFPEKYQGPELPFTVPEMAVEGTPEQYKRPLGPLDETDVSNPVDFQLVERR